VSLDVAVIVTLDVSGRHKILATQVSRPQDTDLYLGANMNMYDIITYILHEAQFFLRS